MHTCQALQSSVLSTSENYSIRPSAVWCGGCPAQSPMKWCPLILQVLSATLRCLQRMLKFPLPSLSLHRGSFAQELFSILGRHARRGAAGGTNQELVLTAFKTMTAVIKGSQEEDVSGAQLQVGVGSGAVNESCAELRIRIITQFLVHA